MNNKHKSSIQSPSSHAHGKHLNTERARDREAFIGDLQIWYVISHQPLTWFPLELCRSCTLPCSTACGVRVAVAHSTWGKRHLNPVNKQWTHNTINTLIARLINNSLGLRCKDHWLKHDVLRHPNHEKDYQIASSTGSYQSQIKGKFINADHLLAQLVHVASHRLLHGLRIGHDSHVENVLRLIDRTERKLLPHAKRLDE